MSTENQIELNSALSMAAEALQKAANNCKVEPAPRPYSTVLIAADTCTDIMDLIHLYLELQKNQIHYTIAEMEFAREHFISLAEDMPVREGTNETGFKRKFLNDI